MPDAWPPGSGEQVVAALPEAGPVTEVWAARAGIRSSGGLNPPGEAQDHRADATLAAGLPREVAPEVVADAVHGWP
ncbi:hypothetical protein ACWD0Z_02980 [Streptomyces sp. NPDC003007]